MSITAGTVVRFRLDGKQVFGTVANVQAKAEGQTPVLLLPDFWNRLPEGKTGGEFPTAELTPVRVCACAHLAYVQEHGEFKGKLFTTGCDFSRMPSRTSKFLPGHDAKAKGFLIRAYGNASSLADGRGLLDAARELGDKIATKVAEGMSNAQREQRQRSTSRNWRQQVDRDERPATREDAMDEVDRLQKQLKVTDPMLWAMAQGVTDDLPGYQGRARGPSGTLLALKDRGLTSWDHLTDLGYKVMRRPTLAETNPEIVVCKDDQGGYSSHNMWWGADESTQWGSDESVRVCRRCGTHDENS